MTDRQITVEADQKTERTQAEIILEVKILGYVFPDGNLALQDINFVVRKNEKVAIIGANGAGKSTLLMLLNGLLVGRGLIKISGLELTTRTVKMIRQKVGLVFQNPDDQLFMPVVLDDVAFGLTSGSKKLSEIERKETAHKVKWILRELKAEHLIYRSTMRLSLGEKKKIALAGILITRPEILLLDEPTAGLDPAGRRWLESYLASLDRTVIIATHDLEFARKICQRVILLHRGQLRADGTSTQVLDKDELLRASGL